ncbi:serine/threonine protein kinase [Couchioplanes caeruleus]|uniref:serine/threonine protein kinase n=1 Tax=Couchioplanes caeruleus TaxID=56438 RepID=UPI0020BF0165|nr:serine/threonine-protein kinase [Couchioplanes caeruleus]UQU62446.1 serine/threonine protein kinase [Couchioplanes caeruleus]
MRLTGDLAEVGPYRILGRLGEGGMGTVYLAADPGGREVAVKVVRPDLALDDQFRRRFRSEVNRARQVPPFCTAEVLDADPYHDPPYLVVEYIDGPSLYEVVQRQGPLNRTTLHSVAVGIATALTAIHGAGVVHRDLKPGNVLFGLGGIKVIDFGIARALEPTSMHTRTNQMVGTVSYMAPERFEHESVSQVGTPADVFAWGAVVAYAGTGRRPFGAESPAATAVRIMTHPPELSGLDEPMRGLVERALAKNPADRPGTRELLDELLATAPQPQTPSGRPAPAGSAPPASMRGTPFLREVVEAAASRRPVAAAPAQRPIPMTPPPAGRRPGPRWVGALRRFEVAAAAAVVLAVTTAVVVTLRATGRPSGAAPDQAADRAATVAPAARPSAAAASTLADPGDATPPALTGHRRVALRPVGTDLDLGVAAGGRVVPAGSAEPTEFVLSPAAGAYRIRTVSGRCLNAGTAVTLGPCTGDAALFIVDPVREDTILLSHAGSGVARWSEDRGAIVLERPGGGTEPTAFTMLDRGPA